MVFPEMGLLVQGGRCACRGARLASRRVPTRLVSHCPAQPASTARTARPDAFQLAGPSLEGLMDDIHTELAAQAVVPGLELEEMARWVGHIAITSFTYDYPLFVCK